jgi:hypothetical protein
MDYLNSDIIVLAFSLYLTFRLAVGCLLASSLGGRIVQLWKQTVSFVNLCAFVLLLLCFAGLLVSGWLGVPSRLLVGAVATTVSRSAWLIYRAGSSEISRSLILVAIAVWWSSRPAGEYKMSLLGVTGPVRSRPVPNELADRNRLSK